MNFAEIGEEIQVKDDYKIEIAAGNHLIISVPVIYGSTAAKFDHPNIASTERKIIELKHYRRNGSKFWTAMPGLSYSFIIPKEKIELNAEKSGLSYVYVKINGQEFCLSVSGGGDSREWTDWISQGCSTCVYRSAKPLKAIAEAAVLGADVDISHRIMDEDEQGRYRELCAFHDTRNKIEKGDKIFLGWGLKFEGKTGPFLVDNRPERKRYFHCENGMYARVKIKYTQIDWTKTADAKGISLV